MYILLATGITLPRRLCKYIVAHSTRVHFELCKSDAGCRETDSNFREFERRTSAGVTFFSTNIFRYFYCLESEKKKKTLELLLYLLRYRFGYYDTNE